MMTIQVNPANADIEIAQSSVGARSTYLSQLLSHRSAGSPGWLQTIRDRALTLLQDQLLPNTRQEEWRFTDLSLLYRTNFQPAQPVADVSSGKWAIADLPHRIVLVNGYYSSELSSPPPIGVTVQHLTEEGLQPYLAQQSGFNEVFTAVNTVCFGDGIVLRIQKNQVIEAPIHLLHLSCLETTSTVSSPRTLVLSETGSAATIIEEYGSLNEGTYWTNAVTEVYLEPNAQLQHIRTQREAVNAFHIGKTAVSQDRDSHYSLMTINLGARISRHNPEITITGVQTETILNGLTLALETQLADTHSLIHFTQPHCTAQQLNKCIVGDRARGVFNGKIYVPKAAQQTNAAQLSRNLLLSPKARVDTKPQLEIIADDVKCAHGATVSQLDDEEIFYLQSRGLDRESASDLLVKGFAAEVLENIPVPELRSQLLKAVLESIHR
jgi:Fe-S cluster assembly protein SufD